MTRLFTLGLILSLGIALAIPAAGASFTLFDWGVRLDGTTYTPLDVLPASVNTATFDLNTGLGTMTVSFGPGAHSAILFLDIEIDESINTFFNEYGEISGAPPLELDWEIDEPGFVFGDIYSNLLAGTLDNLNGVPAASRDDVSFAIGWTLPNADAATVTWRVSLQAPPAGFYLSHVDPDSQAAVYFSSSAVLNPREEIPEPGTWPLVLAGLGLMAAGVRASRRR